MKKYLLKSNEFIENTQHFPFNHPETTNLFEKFSEIIYSGNRKKSNFEPELCEKSVLL